MTLQELIARLERGNLSEAEERTLRTQIETHPEYREMTRLLQEMEVVMTSEHVPQADWEAIYKRALQLPNRYRRAVWALGLAGTVQLIAALILLIGWHHVTMACVLGGILLGDCVVFGGLIAWILQEKRRMDDATQSWSRLSGEWLNYLRGTISSSRWGMAACALLLANGSLQTYLAFHREGGMHPALATVFGVVGCAGIGLHVRKKHNAEKELQALLSVCGDEVREHS